MKQIACIATAAFLAASPAAADDTGEGLSLMEEGAKLFLKGIMQEVEPAMKDLKGMAEQLEPGLRQFVDEMGPAISDLFGQIEDFSVYHPPEILPNGDIILRKKRPDEIIEDQPGEEGEIEL